MTPVSCMELGKSTRKTQQVTNITVTQLKLWLPDHLLLMPPIDQEHVQLNTDYVIKQ